MPKLTNMDRPDYLFLIGGADLEMLTIRQLLTANGFAEGENMADRHLQWGAKLSDYQDLFNGKQIFVGIELTEDITPPPHYLAIDHHHVNSNKRSSLEQVIDLLKNDFGIEIEYTRDLQLVAANDKGYIPAMLEMGASPEEIADIRNRDKDAQGVTEEDERLGEQSIIENQTTEKGITIVKSLTSRFATITDKLYPYSKLLIYDDNDLTCYGEGVKELSKLSIALSKKWEVYSGGGENGYWGISGVIINQKIINQIIKKFAMEPFSYHIFLFPFTWKSEEKERPLSEKLNDFGWKTVVQDNISDYNEKKYFHPYVHPCLFENSENPLIKQFYHKESLDKNLQFEIALKRRIPFDDIEPLFKDQIIKPPESYKFENKKFILIIDKVSLDIYEKQGIGIFAFHLKNTKYQNPEDILLINQFGRRIFPPFLDKHYPDFKIDKICKPIDGTIYREIPCSITIKGKKIENVTEDFAENFKDEPFKTKDYIPAHIKCFFRMNINLAESENESPKAENENRNALLISHVLDDRMFVICWYGATQLTYDYRKQKLTSKQEKKKEVYVLSDLCQRMRGGYEVSGFYRNDLQHRSLALNQTHDSYGYSSNDFWYQYVFIDGYGPSCTNTNLRTEQIEKHTYSRWVEANTLYGITRYSFVCLSEPKENLEKPFPNAGFIADHIQTVYFKMVSLVLVQRAMVLDFSKRINVISFKEDNETDLNEAKLLNVDYRTFINKIFHREVTAQEQGIELYDLLQDHLRVGMQAKELEKEIREMHRLIDLERTNNTNRRMRFLTILGGLILVPNFILTLLNNRFFSKLPVRCEFIGDKLMLDSTILLIVIATCAVLVIYGLLNWDKKIPMLIWSEKISLLNNIKKLIKWITELKWKYKGRWLVLLALIIFLIYLLCFQYLIDKTF